MSTTGLSKRDVDTLFTHFKKYPDIRRIRLFGSRARGDFRPGSDIDLAVMDEGVSEQTLRAVREDLEESSLPFRVDLVHFAQIKEAALKALIMDEGREFYPGG